MVPTPPPIPSRPSPLKPESYSRPTILRRALSCRLLTPETNALWHGCSSRLAIGDTELSPTSRLTLSNIGDCILTLPVLDALRNAYPEGKISCLVPERPKEIFVNNPAVKNITVFNKRAKLVDKIKLFFSLSKEKFDIVVDLRNSFFGAFLPT